MDDPTEGKLHGAVREKVRFPERLKEDGTLQHRAYSRYFVTLYDKVDSEALVDDEHIFRDRKVFSKQMLRSYLKNSLHREAWSGAPWQVKEHLASRYRIDTQIPAHLKYEAQVIQRKINLPRKGEHNGTILNFFGPAKGLPELKPKGPRAKQTAQETDRIRQERLLEYQRAMEKNPNLASSPRNHTARKSDPQILQFINQHPGGTSLAPKSIKKEPEPPPPPPPPPIKYPREDLENPISTSTRPALKFLSDLTIDSIQNETVGGLLETWDTLNVYCEVFMLDSFTFDDYFDALKFSTEEMQSELLVEIHCAVLKRLVNGENDQNGKANIVLPQAPESDQDESSSQTKTSTPTPEPEPERRTTRNSLRKSEAAEARAQAALDAKVHQGAELDQCVKGYGWKRRLAKRDFANGRWIVILVGLLNLFSGMPQHKVVCESLLAKLAPPDVPPTEETSIAQYWILDINERVKIVQFLCMLSIGTQFIRDYMEECTQTMTKFRKDKIEWQRKRKAHLEELKNLVQERRDLQPEAPAAAPEIEQLAEQIEDEEMKDGDETEDAEKTEEAGADSEDEPIPARSLRRAKDREAERKKKREEEKKQKERAKAEKAKKPSKEARQLEKILKKIENVKDSIKECETEIAVCDDDLRENDCPRTRVLGKDRFWNRYYWFERNAMPYGGLPDSSTAYAEYANGCLWVQGPDPTEREGFIDVTDAENAKYTHTFGCTIPERKSKEEGGTSLKDAFQWGYYDEPEDLDRLIGWLSEKGTREVKLRKELQTQREQISIHMEKRKGYLSTDREQSLSSPEPITRVSTRTKTYLIDPKHRFTQWHNTTALRELGHIHSEPPKAQKKGVARPVKRKAAELVVEDEPRQTRGSANKRAKGLGRQGSRYDF